MVVNRMKNVPHSLPFHHPVQEKKLPSYYKIITSPMDPETMRNKCKKHMYRSRENFLRDVTQMVQNSTQSNGSESILIVDLTYMTSNVCMYTKPITSHIILITYTDMATSIEGWAMINLNYAHCSSIRMIRETFITRALVVSPCASVRG